MVGSLAVVVSSARYAFLRTLGEFWDRSHTRRTCCAGCPTTMVSVVNLGKSEKQIFCGTPVLEHLGS